jgi:hypothetical protein
MTGCGRRGGVGGRGAEAGRGRGHRGGRVSGRGGDVSRGGDGVGGGPAGIGVVDPDDVADGVDAHPVEATFVQPAFEGCRAVPVRVGQIGHGELAAFGPAGIAEAGQLRRQIEEVGTERRYAAESFVDAAGGDAVQMAHALGERDGGREIEAAGERVDDLVVGHACASGTGGVEHHREPEPIPVRGVQRRDPIGSIAR